MEKIKVGIIGCGGIANGTHIPGYKKCSNAIITALCDINPDALIKTAQKCNVPESNCFSDYNDLIKSGLIDAVDICTPNYLHCRIANAAIEAGFPVSIEKPMGMSYAECDELRKKAEAKNLPVFVCFSWRYKDVARYMKQLIDEGKVGKLYHSEIRCIKDSGLWEGRRLEWRFEAEKGGSGVLGDLGSHMFDQTRFLAGEFAELYADRGTEIKRRMKLDSDEYADVTTDDWCHVVGRLQNGVSATVTVSRCATTLPNLVEIELYGEKGFLKFVSGPDGDHVTWRDNAKKPFVTEELPVPAEMKAVQSQAFVNMVLGITDKYTTTVYDGLKCQAIIDAALKSCETHRLVKLSEIEG